MTQQTDIHTSEDSINQNNTTQNADLKNIRFKLRTMWNSMLTRCNNNKANNYQYYGGKGVKVCKRWMRDFSLFFDWAINNGYSPDLQIDRIDGRKDYTPANCHFVTQTKNLENRSRHRFNFKRKYMNLPMHVVYFKQCNRYTWVFSRNGKQYKGKFFKTPQLAKRDCKKKLKEVEAAMTPENNQNQTIAANN